MLTAPYSHNSARSDTPTEASFSKLRAAEAGTGKEHSIHASELYPFTEDLPFINSKTCLWDLNIGTTEAKGNFLIGLKGTKV